MLQTHPPFGNSSLLWSVTHSTCTFCLNLLNILIRTYCYRVHCTDGNAEQIELTCSFLSDLPDATQLVRSRTGIQTPATDFKSPRADHCDVLSPVLSCTGFHWSRFIHYTCSQEHLNACLSKIRS